MFEQLGAPAALVYEAIEQGHGSSPATIQLRTGLSRTAVTEALASLDGWHLIAGDTEAGYQLTSTDADLNHLAERFGIIRARARRVATYREQRRRWWAYLDRHLYRLSEEDLAADAQILELLDEMRLNDLPPPDNPAKHHQAGAE